MDFNLCNTVNCNSYKIRGLKKDRNTLRNRIKVLEEMLGISENSREDTRVSSNDNVEQFRHLWNLVHTFLNQEIDGN